MNRNPMFTFLCWLHTLQLSNMPLKLCDLPIHQQACICNFVIMGSDLPALKQDVSEMIMNSTGIFPVDFPVSFGISYLSISTGKKNPCFDYFLLSSFMSDPQIMGKTNLFIKSLSSQPYSTFANLNIFI